MTVEEAHEVILDIDEYETLREDTTYSGEGKIWTSHFVYRLYEHGYEIKQRSKE